MGFVVDGEVKAAYNHFDSYPSGLGVQVGAFAATLVGERLGQYADAVRGLRLIDEDTEPSESERKNFARFADEGVSTGKDWYSLLRQCQGDPEKTLDSGVLLDGLSFAHDSLFCEWGYLLNFDTGQIEVYRGFQTQAEFVKGRFANGETNRGYASITLLGTLPFTFGDSAQFWSQLEAAIYAEDEQADPQAAIEAAFRVQEVTAD
jgi:hypothetical protein